MKIETPNTKDIPAIAAIVEATGLFPSEMLADMIAPSLAANPGPDVWLVAREDGTVAGFAYAVPEEMAEGTWNLLAIGVDPGTQTTGIGRALVEALEADLRKDQQRVLIVDTSGSPEFDGARAFYPKLGFAEVGRIPEFWALGDDKVTFWKAL